MILHMPRGACNRGRPVSRKTGPSPCFSFIRASCPRKQIRRVAGALREIRGSFVSLLAWALLSDVDPAPLDNLYFTCRRRLSKTYALPYKAGRRSHHIFDRTNQLRPHPYCAFVSEGKFSIGGRFSLFTLAMT